MNIKQIPRLSLRVSLLLSTIAGVLIPFSLAPYDVWVLAILSTTLLAWLITDRSAKHVMLISFTYGLGMFGHGVSWVYISIHDFGFTGAPLAVVMTFLFASFLALVFSAPFYIYGKLNAPNFLKQCFLFTAIWTLGEWIRSWLFTGFPWLYVGYAHIDSPLATWAPIGGVFSLSFLSVLSGILLFQLFRWITRALYNSGKKPPYFRRYAISSSLILSVIWLCPLVIQDIEWTQPTSSPQTISIVQPNVELMRKWNPYDHPGIIEELDEAADAHWESDIQLWPEAAIPSLYHDVYPYIEDVEKRALKNNTSVISGVLYDNMEAYEVYNGIIGIGLSSGVYFKQKLVPFGEYVPFEDQLRGIISFFDLPNSVIRIGPYRKNALTSKTVNGHQYGIAPYICYEVVYPDFVAKNARDAELLITISNDAWFGKSIGPLQHFQMVRMRALENQKYFARATNTGISAVIDHTGKVRVKGNQFTREVISGTVELRQGATPFSRVGSYPIIILCFLILIIATCWHRLWSRT